MPLGPVLSEKMFTQTQRQTRQSDAIIQLTDKSADIKKHASWPYAAREVFLMDANVYVYAAE